MNADIREYRDTDYDACRGLWVLLTEQHRDFYDDPAIGGDDPGRGLDDYLANPDRRITWVAEIAGEVVGMTGLIVSGDGATVEPAVVAGAFRSRGLERALVARAVSEAERIGIGFLSVHPVARNAEAVSFFVFVANGFDIVGHVDLFRDLRPERDRKWKPGLTIHGKELRH